jgi:hypothetical protein
MMDEMRNAYDRLPEWQSHKVVRAARITGVSEGVLPTTLFRWHLAGGVVVDVDELLATRVPRGVPTVGGYLIVYPDGYRSWSPADVFEAGYTLVAAEENANVG